MNLSKNFTLSELTISQEAVRSGLKNLPTQSQLANLVQLCDNILQPLRDRVRRPVIISSGFRSKTINTRIGGSKNSQHCMGQAADFTIPGMTVEEVVGLIRKMSLPIDQCINEGNAWCHVSYGPRHRKQYLKATREGGVVHYKPL